MFANILLSTLLVSMIAFVGAVILAVRGSDKTLSRIITLLVALSAGTFLGGAFIHLLPEAHESLPVEQVYMSTIAAYLVFFFIESILHWHHSHEGEYVNHHHAVGYMNLLGDTFHNFLDGLVIAGAFAVGPELGVPTAIAVALHEIPQEIGDFGVLLHAGFSRSRALVLNFSVALTVVLGGVVGYLALERVETIAGWLVPFAAGSFIYIGSTDLVPQIKGNKSLAKALINLAVFVGGIILMYGLKFLKVG